MSSRALEIVLCVGVVLASGVDVGAQNIPPRYTPPSLPRLGVGIGRVEGFGARALGMGGAFTAVADDATAALWNPAGLGQLFEIQVQAGGSSTDVSSDRDVSSVSTLFIPGTDIRSYSRYELSDDSSSGLSPQFLTFAYPLDVGPGRLVLSASTVRGTNYFENYRFDNRSDTIEVLRNENEERTEQTYTSGGSAYRFSQVGQQDTYNLSVAYSALDDRLLAGLTYSRVDGEQDFFSQNSTIWLQEFNPGASQSNTGAWDYRDSEEWATDFEGWNVTLGVLARPFRWLTLGVSYRSETSLDYTYDVSFQTALTNTVTGMPPEDSIYSAVPPESRLQGTTDLDLPEVWTIGLALLPSARVTVAFDYARSDWSDTTVTLSGERGEWVNDPAVTQESFPAQPLYWEVYYPSLTRVTDDDGQSAGGEQFVDEVFRAGLEYRLTPGGFTIPLRAGYFQEFAASGIPTQEQPEISGYSLGAGMSYEGLFIDIAFVYETSRTELLSGEGAYASPADYYGFQTPYLAEVETELVGGEFEQETLRVLLSMGYRF